MSYILTQERYCDLKEKLADPRINIFSCYDVGGTDGADDWMLTLTDFSDKYGRLGVNIYSSEIYNTSLQAQLFFNCRINNELKPEWGNLRLEEALADRVSFKTRFWGRENIGLEFEILALNPRCFRFNIAFENRGKESVDFAVNPLLIFSDGSSSKDIQNGKAVHYMNNYFRIDVSRNEEAVSNEKTCAFSVNLLVSKKLSELETNSEKYLKMDIEAFKQKQYTLSHPDFLNKLPHAFQTLSKKIHNDLRCNILNYKDTFFSAPNRIIHKGQWLWDTCFHLFPYSVFAPTTAEKLLENLFIAQQDNGFIPISLSHKEGVVEYATQPPIIPFVLETLFESEDLYIKLYPKLKKYCTWLEEARKLPNGLFRWDTAGESGMDNSPRFDEILGGPTTFDDLNLCMHKIPKNTAHIDISSQMALFYLSMHKIARKINFLEDSSKWKLKYNKLKELINDFLYDVETKFYYDRKLNGEWKKVKTPASFWPLLAEIPNQIQAKQILRHIMNEKEFLTKIPIPSVAVDEPSFCFNYWRGPVWCNMVYMTILGLKKYKFDKEAEIISKNLLEGIKRELEHSGHLWEIYDPFGGPSSCLEKKHLGPGENARGFAGWTACCLNLINELSKNSNCQ